MPRSSEKNGRAQLDAAEQQQAELARIVLELQADALEATRARLSTNPTAVSALSESVALLRDAANVVDPGHPQEMRAVAAEEQPSGA